MTVGEAAPRRRVLFFCANRHVTPADFVTDVEVPQERDCPRCGLPAGRDQKRPPEPPIAVPYKTPLDYAVERRTEAERAEGLDAALAKLRANR